MAFVPAMALGLAMFATVAMAADSSPYPIAGVNPSSRPQSAPVIDSVKKDAAWFERSLKGVDAPYPASVEKSLKDQGNWFTPFSVPGMPGKYDIRHRHS